MELRPSNCVCLPVFVLLCTSAVRCPGDEGCRARQAASFTLCCQMSSQKDVGHNTYIDTHSSLPQLSLNSGPIHCLQPSKPL